VIGLYRLILSGRFDGATRVIRQTDGGSDNVGWVTFAVNCMLVREGAVDQLDWIRLLPGHSHNESDGLGCSTGTGTGTGDPVLGSPDPVVNNARWRPLGSQGENKTRKNIVFTAIHIQVYIHMRLQNQATGTAHARLPSGGHEPSRCHLRTLLIAPQAALAAVWR
jgi:hypothetical protein